MFEKILIILFGIGPLIALPVGLLTPLIYEWMLKITRFLGIMDNSTFNNPFGNGLLAAWIATCTVLIFQSVFNERKDKKTN